MKRMRIVFVFTMFVFVLNSCSKGRRLSAEIIKDCSGIYLKTNKRILKVCNQEILAKYQSGDEITIEYEKEAECEIDLLDQPICFIHYDFDFLIKINKVL